MKVKTGNIPAVLFAILLVIILAYLADQNERLADRFAYVTGQRSDLHTDAPRPLPKGVSGILGSNNNYVGPQMNAADLDTFLYDRWIRRVVDLAGEAKAESILPNSAEAAICDRQGIAYFHFNVEGKDNQLNESALAVIDSLMEEGDTFVHCRNGQHRAKVPVGRYYARSGYRFETIVDLMGWGSVVADQRYDQYTNNVWGYVQRFNHPVNHSK